MSTEYIAGQSASEFYNQSGEPNQVDLVNGATESALNATAQRLSNRQDQSNQVGGSSNAVSEDVLLSKQRELSVAAKRGDLLAVDRLEQEVFALASQMVGGANAPTRQPEQETFEEESTADALIAQYGQEQVTETLQWSAESLSTEVAAALNEELAGDGAKAHVAYSALDNLRKNPELIASGDQNVAFDLSVANQLAEEYGFNGEKLAAINAGLVAGKCTRAHAARLVLSDPELAQVAMSAARSGLIKVAL